MLPLLEQHPGLLYVIATLLPLTSFVLLLLGAALRMAGRASRATSPFAAGLYNLFGGDQPRRLGAYVATAAIGLAFVLCAIGFVWHQRDMHQVHELEAQLASAGQIKSEKIRHEEIENLERQIDGIEHKWKDKIDWAHVGWTRQDLKKPGAVLQLGYRIDNLASIMFLMVTFIATLIHLFSMGYMADELQSEVEDHQVHTDHGHLHRRGRFGRFFMYLSLFCFSMLNLMLADNLFQVFVSWELVGVCSYLLVGFYFERTSASNAANKAFITNRVGDAGFIIGLLVIWTYVGTFNFEQIFQRVRAPLLDGHHARVDNGGQIVRADPTSAPDGKTITLTMAPDGSQSVLFPLELGHIHHDEFLPTAEVEAVATATGPKDYSYIPYWLLVVAGLGIFTGCVGKSAQFPLHVWLPDAMEGPTPVSALIHAATMVAAGVYLVGRCYPLFTPEVLLVIAYTGGITLFVAATVAIVMTDIKKVLAYSTVSQLGYMMLALGVGGWVAGLFHLLTHAFFKALLFLGSGSVIYGCHHEQEMTKMGGLGKKMPITAGTMLIGVLAIAGTPLFAGWYSKDAIIANAFGFIRIHPEHTLLLLLPLITAGITTFYMFRMWFMTFTGTPRDHHVYEHAHESPWLMTLPLVLLAVCSIAAAWGWPVWDAEKSAMESHLHHAQYPSVQSDFGRAASENFAPSEAEKREHYYAHEYHGMAGALALLAAGLGFVFALVIYRLALLDPAESTAGFPATVRFLWHKWYFDEIYSVLLVRPSLVVAHWCRAFDTHVIDGFANFLGRLTVWVARWDGRFDGKIVDGLVNLTGNTIHAVGTWLRGVQTGYIRSYILFLALAALGLFVLLTYFIGMAAAG